LSTNAQGEGYTTARGEYGFITEDLNDAGSAGAQAGNKRIVVMIACSGNGGFRFVRFSCFVFEFRHRVSRFVFNVLLSFSVPWRHVPCFHLLLPHLLFFLFPSSYALANYRTHVNFRLLSTATWAKHPFLDDIQTREYSCPEVMLGRQVGTSADI
jgi:hypothetical protein